jgi:UDP-N-acetylglucosamine--N-acetylmuramyl-(pentapeptide) pyrophosphoryl-undecaprenol N-acetylglucosamine transferase
VGSSKNPLKILIASGSSGGHLIPAINTAEKLSEKQHSIHFLIAPSSNWKLPERLLGYPVHTVVHASFPRNVSLQMFLFPFKFLWNICVIFKLILTLKPNLVIGFGSIVSFLAVCIGKFWGVKTLIHEQNAVFGMANKKLLPIVDRVALTFPMESCGGDEKYCVTGYPLRVEVREAACNVLYTEPGLADKLHILVVGGSQGARTLNEAVCDMWSRFSDEELSGYSVLHIAGKNNVDAVRKSYDGLPTALEREVIDFTDEMTEVYLKTDLVIGRAGAGIVSEVMALARPSLLVPYPYAESHQLENARFLEEASGCEVIEQGTLDSVVLAERLRFFKSQPERLKSLADNAQEKSILDGTDRLADLIDSMLEGVAV